VRSKAAWEEHAELIEAIANRDAGRACTLMRLHTERTREIYQEQRRQKTAKGN
jgi:DNA-binding GntR family transcriptional regulator